MSEDNKDKYYDLWLPVFKQGDDLAANIEEASGNVAEGFKGLAEQYEEAAKVCRRFAGVAAEVPELSVDAGTHHIGITGPSDRLDPLVKEGLLQEEEWGDDDMDVEWGDKLDGTEGDIFDEDSCDEPEPHSD